MMRYWVLGQNWKLEHILQQHSSSYASSFAFFTWGHHVWNEELPLSSYSCCVLYFQLFSCTGPSKPYFGRELYKFLRVHSMLLWLTQALQARFTLCSLLEYYISKTYFPVSYFQDFPFCPYSYKRTKNILLTFAIQFCTFILLLVLCCYQILCPKFPFTIKKSSSVFISLGSC